MSRVRFKVGGLGSLYGNLVYEQAVRTKMPTGEPKEYVRRNFWEGLVTLAGIEELNRHCFEWLVVVESLRGGDVSFLPHSVQLRGLETAGA